MGSGINGDPNIIGRTIRFGTAERSSLWSRDARGLPIPADEVHRDYYLPFHEEIGPKDSGSIWISGGKMRPGVTSARPGAVYTIGRRLEAQYPSTNTGPLPRRAMNDVIGGSRPAS